MKRYLTEWLNENMHRVYPFASEATGTCNIPTQLLVDAFFLTSPNITAFYLSKISKAEYGYYFYFKATTDETENNILDFSEYPVFISEDTLFGTEVEIALFADSEDDTVMSSYVSGSIFIGKINSLKGYPAVIENPNPSNPLGLPFFQGIVREETMGVTGITVNDKTYTGNVVINCGDGIEAEVSGESVLKNGDTYLSGATITLKVTDYTPPSDNLVIIKDTDILARFPVKPVRSINGYSPDAAGNIAFTAHVSDNYGECGEQCINIAASSVGEGTIQFYATITDKLDCDEETSFTNIIANLNTLKTDIVELTNKIVALDSHVSVVSQMLENR